MDTNAANYDAAANVNSNTWCVPAVVGCMMPDVASAKEGYANPQSASLAYNQLVIPGGIVDGLNPNYNVSVTVHRQALCAPQRYGCNEPARTIAPFGLVDAMNKDPLATVNTFCYWPKAGCLNPLAFNFGCVRYSEVGPCQLPPNETVTVHSSGRCRFADLPPAPPAPPPPPRLPAGEFTATFRVTMGITVLLTCDAATAMATAFKTTFASVAGITANIEEIVEVEVCGATYRRLSARIGRLLSVSESEIDVLMAATLADEAAADAALSTLQANVGNSRSSLQAAFGDALGITVTSAPNIAIEVIYTRRTDVPPPMSGLPPLVIGISAGGAAGLIVVVIVAYVVWKRRKAKALKVVLPE